ncbi:hypothetical protein FOZ62_010567, partial [Perkinsus olseni]
TYTARNNTRTPWWEDGEFLALQHAMQLLGLEFEPLPSRLYFEQAVPLVVTRAAPSEVCDATRHEMMGIQTAAKDSEAVNALLSFRLTAAHLIEEWSGDPPDSLKGVFGSGIDRDTAEGMLRRALHDVTTTHELTTDCLWYSTVLDKWSNRRVSTSYKETIGHQLMVSLIRTTRALLWGKMEVPRPLSTVFGVRFFLDASPMEVELIAKEEG